MKILVLAGGTSPERDVSLQSGRCVAEALIQRGHTVDQLDPQNVSLSELDATRWDIAVPMVHGTGGEDGVLQRCLLQSGLPYAGSSPQASELTFDKIRTKDLLKRHDIAVPDGVVATRSHLSSALKADLEGLGSAVVTKPSCQGSSVGISIVRTPDQLPAALELAFQYGDECLIERFIEGREVTVAVVDGTALPALEIVPAVSWYDYHAKYADDRTEYRFEGRISSNRLGDIATRACEICGVSAIARVDFRVDSDGRALLLEINTIPGMTSHSLVPKAALRAGLSLGELLEQVIRKRLAA